MRSLLLVSLLARMASCSRYQVTPLASAARRGDLDAIDALLKAGADPDEPSGINNWTPLQHAIHRHQRSSVLWLVQGGANVNRPCCGGLTPLMMAAGYGQQGIVQALLDLGADPRLRNSRSLTALDYALSGVVDVDAFTLGKCQTGTVRVLIKHAPDLAGQPTLTERHEKTVKACPEIEVVLRRG
jgi:hypothetical protein